MLIIDRFILKLWGSYFFSIVVGLLVMVFVFDSLNSLAGEGDLLDKLKISLQIIPPTLEMIAPLAGLIATLLCFISLSKHSEIIALKSAGLSQFRIVRIIFIFCLFIVGFLYINQSYLVRLLNAETKSFNLRSQNLAQQWYYFENKLIKINDPLLAFDQIKSVEVIEFDFDSEQSEHHIFTALTKKNNHWQAKHAEFVIRQKEHIQQKTKNDFIITNFNLDNLIKSPIFPSTYQPIGVLYESWRKSNLGEHVINYSLLLMLRKISYLGGFLVLILLAIIFSDTNPRSNKTLVQLIRAIMIYYFYWFLDQIFFVMATEGVVNIFWGAFGANILLLIYISWFLRFRKA
ncbi:MAG: LptF/LptG family permease [SAR324 cluster bacterium]|nr:LptF/LptG family permease [SAR324 cluster bacterium]